MIKKMSNLVFGIVFVSHDQSTQLGKQNNYKVFRGKKTKELK